MGADCATQTCCQNEAEILKRKKGTSIVSGATMRTTTKRPRIIEDNVDDDEGTGAINTALSDREGAKKKKSCLLKAIESEDQTDEDCASHFDMSNIEESKGLEDSDEASTCSSKCPSMPLAGGLLQVS